MAFTSSFTVHVPCARHYTCLLSLAVFPFCTPQTEVALCAAEPTFACAVRPQGQPHICKSGLTLWNLHLHQRTTPLLFPANSLIFPLAHDAVMFSNLIPPWHRLHPPLPSVTRWSHVQCINASAAPHPYCLYHWVSIHIWNCLWCLLFIDHHCHKGWCESAQPMSTLKVKCRPKT